MSSQKPMIDPRPIALTMGDPAGISAEITAFAWQKRDQYQLSPFVVLSRKSLYSSLPCCSPHDLPVEVISSPQDAMDIFHKALPVLEIPDEIMALPGVPDKISAPMTIHSISKAVDLVKADEACAIVTNPINKHVLYEAGFKFPGHTEYLAELAEQWGEKQVKPVMMLASDKLRTVPLTIHIPLSEVPAQLTKQLIIETVRIISNDMNRFFGISSARIAVAGLNPHAGENGAMGRAEIEIIEPALQALKAENINVSGPFPADTLFHASARKSYDVVLGMYHDQALIPIKTLSFDEGVNTTLGLPFVRTSPDHGTAYDIAGQGIANPTSLIAALKLAQKMADQSQLDQQMNGQNQNG